MFIFFLACTAQVSILVLPTARMLSMHTWDDILANLIFVRSNFSGLGMDDILAALLQTLKYDLAKI